MTRVLDSKVDNNLNTVINPNNIILTYLRSDKYNH